MVRVGIAGIGFMGWIHYLAYQKASGVQLKAICSRDEKKRAGDWRGIQGNFGPPGEQIDLSGVRAHQQYQQLLDDPDVDLIDICLPPDMHAQAAMDALQAGKHVLVEKPLALHPSDCDKMVAAAQKTGRHLLAAHVLPFFPEYAAARTAISSGDYGKLRGGNFKRVISDPQWLKDFYDPEKVGGPLIDLHVHDAHFIRLLFGMPDSVISQGRMRGEVVEYCESLFQFDDSDLVVRATSGVIHQQGRGFTHGFEIHLEQATLHFEFAVFADTAESMPLKILTSTGEVERPDLGDGDPVHAFVQQINEAVRSIERDEPSKLLSGRLARDAIVLCQKQSESVRRGQAVKVAHE